MQNGGCIQNKTLQPGAYTIFDSRRKTWSQNSQSGGIGHAVINGNPITKTAVAQRVY